MTERMTAARYRREHGPDEDSFRRAVQRYATANGWIYWHPSTATIQEQFLTAGEGDAGFPDTVFARNGVVLFVEFKSAKGRLSAKQKVWLAELAGVLPSSIRKGFTHHNGPIAIAVWSPADWPTIEHALGNGRTK